MVACVERLLFHFFWCWATEASPAGEIEFSEFLHVFERQKEAMAKLTDETDTLVAFVALGGGADKSGAVSADKLSKLCKARPCTYYDVALSLPARG